MKPRSRRRFLRETAVLVPGLGLAGGALHALQSSAAPKAAEPARVLRALADAVLPRSALGVAGVDAAVLRFRSWSDGFAPVAELDHPYLSSDDLEYGPPDPRPGWHAQLEALDLEAHQRHGVGFAELELDQRTAVLRRQLPRDLPASLPNPTEASHIAVALMSWYFASPQATDLCYGARIGRYECRGLPSAPARPAPIGDETEPG